MNNLKCILIVFLMSSCITLSAQSTFDKLLFEEAQTAYANKNYLYCIQKIDELNQRGVKGLLILHLKIMATNKVTYEHLTDEIIIQFKKDVAFYLKNYDNEDFIEQYKDIYEISKTLNQDRWDEGSFAFKKASDYYYKKKDYKNAMQWFLKADTYYGKNQGSHVKYLIGLMHEKGLDIEQNYIESFRWHTKAADIGHKDAQFKLGYFYHTGQGVEKDLNKAIEWYTKAAEQGNVNAQTNLGRLYMSGDGLEKNLDKAIELYKKAIDGGYKNCFYLALAYEQKGNYSEALKYYQQGNETGKLGLYFYEGKVTTQDYGKTVEYWESVAEKASIYNLCLAVAYFSGKGVEKDADKAYSLFMGVLEKYKEQLLKMYMKADGAHHKKHFPNYAKDETVFFEWLEKEHNIKFEE